MFKKNLLSVLKDERLGDPDRGDLVQTVIIVAGFAVAALGVLAFVTTAILGEGARLAACVEVGTHTAHREGLECIKEEIPCPQEYYNWDTSFTETCQERWLVFSQAYELTTIPHSDIAYTPAERGEALVEETSDSIIEQSPMKQETDNFAHAKPLGLQPSR